MGKVKVKEPKSTGPKISVEVGSPYDLLGYGPRIKRLTTWDPERWRQQRDGSRWGLTLASRNTMRFHTWEERHVPSLGFAWYAAITMARGNVFDHHTLVLAGPTGTGKTHLALACAWEWFDDGLSVLFRRVDDLLDELRKGYEDGSYHQLMDYIRQCSLLVLDDLGTEQLKDWAEERVDRIVDWRYASQMPLIVTTNAKSEELPPRVASRLADKRFSVVCQIDAEDYRKDGLRNG